MDKNEAQDLLDALLPVGKTRWLRVEIHDQAKLLDILKWAHGTKHDGYVFTDIYVAHEVPWLVEATELRDELIEHMLQLNIPVWKREALTAVIQRHMQNLEDTIKRRSFSVTENPNP